MKKCKSCGENFDPTISVSFNDVSEPMSEEIEREMEKEKNCPDCILATAFENESMKDV